MAGENCSSLASGKTGVENGCSLGEINLGFFEYFTLHMHDPIVIAPKKSRECLSASARR